MHWHVDYLAREQSLVDAWWFESELKHECQWTSFLSKIGVPTPPGFGSSDCACVSHLLLFHDEEAVAKAWQNLWKWSKHRLQRF